MSEISQKRTLNRAVLNFAYGVILCHRERDVRPTKGPSYAAAVEMRLSATRERANGNYFHGGRLL